MDEHLLLEREQSAQGPAIAPKHAEYLAAPFEVWDGDGTGRNRLLGAYARYRAARRQAQRIGIGCEVWEYNPMHSAPGLRSLRGRVLRYPPLETGSASTIDWIEPKSEDTGNG